MTQISNHLDTTRKDWDGPRCRAEWQAGNAVSFFILPDSVYNAFTARHNLIDITDYSKLRSVFSAVDIAELRILRLLVANRLGIESSDISTPTNCETAGEDFDRLNSELLTTIRYYEEDAATISGVESYLAGRSDDEVVVAVNGGVDDRVNYRVVYLQNTLYIIVEEGFLSTMANPAKRLAFLSRVLESAYAISPVSAVNRTSWYRQYLAALAASV